MEARPDGAVVDAVRAQLVEADAESSLDGLLAIELARRVERTPSNGLVGLSRELDRRLAAATGRVLPPDPADTPSAGGPVEPDDQVTAARRARDAKLAAGGAG